MEYKVQQRFKRQTDGKRREIYQLQQAMNQLKEEKKSLVTKSFSTLPQVYARPVAETGTSCPVIDLEMHPSLSGSYSNNKHVVNNSDSAYIVAVDDILVSIVAARLPSINENNSVFFVHASMQSKNKQKRKSMKDVNENNTLRKSANSMASSLTSSSSSGGIYDVEENLVNMNGRINIDSTVNYIKDKTNLNYVIIHSDSLSNALPDLRRM